MRHIGFVGLGAMGLPMAENLVRKQFHVTGFDMKQDALTALEKAGGQSAASAAEAAKGADALVLMVVNIAQAESVLFEAGALAAMPKGATVVLMATCPPKEVEQLGKRIEHAGYLFIDAPVSGGVVGAQAGTLTIMAAAPPKVFEPAKALLSAMGEKLFHVGEQSGQGAMIKTVNQLLCGVHIAALAEGMALAEKAGISGQVVLDILGGSAASSWMLHNRGPRMVQDNPQVTSAVDIFVKDLGIVMDAGYDAKAALPVAAAAHQMFIAASAQGHGLKDDSQVVLTYRDLAGLKKN
jgi:L-threonate 2-dehydrogenase